MTAYRPARAAAAPMWAVAAPVIGVCSAAAAFVPAPGGLAGIAGGVVGLAAGVAGIRAARRTLARAWPAVSGIVVSVLAVAAGVALVFVHPVPTRAAGNSTHVLRNELDVVMGTFGHVAADTKRGRLPVTFTNKSGGTGEFAVAIAAFGRDGHQVDSETATVVLAARSSEEQDMFKFSPAPLLDDASFRIIAARKVTGWHR